MLSLQPKLDDLTLTTATFPWRARPGALIFSGAAFAAPEPAAMPLATTASAKTSALLGGKRRITMVVGRPVGAGDHPIGGPRARFSRLAPRARSGPRRG